MEDMMIIREIGFALDVITSEYFRVIIPLLLALAYYLWRKRSFMPVLIYLVSNWLLDFFWRWYKSPLNCPLWKVCSDAMVVDPGYLGFWWKWGIAIAVPVLLILGWIGYSVHKIAKNGGLQWKV
jgi:hypothetical protein